MKTISIVPILLLILVIGVAKADQFDPRAFLGMTAGVSVDAAISRGKKDNKKVLVLALDSKKNNQSFHIKGMLEFEETKQLIRDRFLLVITDFKNKNIRDLIGEDGMDRPMYFLFNTDGKLIQKGTTAMGGAAGAALVKTWAGIK